MLNTGAAQVAYFKSVDMCSWPFCITNLYVEYFSVDLKNALQFLTPKFRLNMFKT